MAVIQVEKIGKVFNGEYLWKDISFSVDEQEKVGLLGPNGCGKSTLIKALLGEIDIDEGDIFFAKERSLATVSQGLSTDEESASLREFLLASFEDVVAMERKMKRQQKKMELLTDDPAGLEKAILKYTSATEAYERLDGYVMDARIREVLFGLGFCEEDLNRTMDTLSGGQKTRVSLARSLVREPDILILDEPNNYLDLEALSWLEAFLAAYQGAVLVVSHDRYFLDAVIGRVLEFENKKIYSYQGNFTEFMEKKEQIISDHNKQYHKQQKKIAETEAYIDKYKAGIKSKQARGRKSQLARLDRLEKRGENHYLNMSFEQSVTSGRKVLEVKELSVGYGDELVVEDLSFEVIRGQRLGIIGPNGCGKTTLLKAIGEILPYKGKIQLGINVEIGYFSQEHEGLDKNLTVLDVLMDAGVPDYQTAREILAQYGFTNDDVDTLAGRLSGGEKSRLLMAILLFDQPNLLLLDEPTNHLDVYARQSLEKALADYPGTMIFVSHDRYFLKKVATQILYYEDGFKKHPEGFISYLNRPKEGVVFLEADEEVVAKPMSDKKRERVRTAQINEAERAVDELEQKINEIELLLTDEAVYADPVACEKVNKERLQLEEDLDEKMRIWERLMD